MDTKRRDRILRYVYDRRCREGGYCFYRLEEPNSSDTYSALAILHLLGEVDSDEKTSRFLRSFQHASGNFDNLLGAHFALKGLQLLNQAPLFDPFPYLKKQQRAYDVRRVPTGEVSIFKHIYLLIDLYHSLNIPITPPMKDEIASFVLSLQASDGGFGWGYGTLIETAQALSILQHLKITTHNLGTDAFISRCDNSLFGYVNVPRTMPGYIEHIYWGLKARLLTGSRPLYPEICRDIVIRSQNMTGGFSRTTYGGIANLENTLYAIESLVYLRNW